GAPGPETEISGGKLRFLNSSRETEIWGRQTGGGHPLRAGLSPPLRVRLPGTGAEKSGVCPSLEVDLNCTQECLSDGECADNLKCCRAGCATVCQMPNAGHRLPPAQPLTEPLPGKQHVSGQLRCCHNVCGKVSCVTPVF
ncbi:hypothetical protein E2I00_003522, partial [Balaenoptera physalus]